MLPNRGTDRRRNININKRSRRYIFQFMRGAIYGILILSAFYFLTTSETIRINDISVDIEGQNLLEVSEIENSLNNLFKDDFVYLPSRFIYLFARGPLEETLTIKYPAIARVNTKWRPWGDFNVEILERTPIYSYCLSFACGSIDQDAVLFTSTKDESLLVIDGETFFGQGENVLDQKTYEFIQKMEEFITEREYSIDRIKYYLLSGGVDKIIFNIVDGPELIFSSEMGLYKTSRALSIAVFDIFGSSDTHVNFGDLEYLDFRFENKIIYK